MIKISANLSNLNVEDINSPELNCCIPGAQQYQLEIIAKLATDYSDNSTPIVCIKNIDSKEISERWILLDNFVKAWDLDISSVTFHENSDPENVLDDLALLSLIIEAQEK